MDTYATQSLKELISVHTNDVLLSDGVRHNQYKKTLLINLYMNSLFTHEVPEDAVFYNIVKKAYSTFKKKFKLNSQSFRLYHPTVSTNYLLQKSYWEFVDDYHFGAYLLSIKEQLARYGTVVFLNITESKNPKNNTVKILEWDRVLTDPTDWKRMPVAYRGSKTISSIINDKRFDTTALQADLKDDVDLSERITTYTLYGFMPSDFGKDDYAWRQVVIAVKTDDASFDNSDYYELSNIELEREPIHIYAMDKIPNRTMGVSPIEDSLETQVVVNELANLAMEQIRATSKVLITTTDPELDGLDASEIGSLEFIYHTNGSDIRQIPLQPPTTNAIIIQMEQWIAQHREHTQSQDVALGNQIKGVPLGTTQIASHEVDTHFTEKRDELAKVMEYLFKTHWIRLLTYYFHTRKSVSELLTKTQLAKFKELLAGRFVEMLKVEAILNDAEVLPDEEYMNIALEDANSSAWTIYEEDIDIDDIIDRTRVLTIDDQKEVSNRLLALNNLIPAVAKQPEMYPQYDLNDLIQEQLSLTQQEVLVETAKYGKKTPSDMAKRMQQDVLNGVNNFGKAKQ